MPVISQVGCCPLEAGQRERTTRLRELTLGTPSTPRLHPPTYTTRKALVAPAGRAMRTFAAFAWLVALLSGATQCAACELLDPKEPFTFTERSADGTWMGSIKLRDWQDGTMVSITFNTNTEVKTLEYSTFVRVSPRTTELELLGRAPNNVLRLEGKGGCWQPEVSKCTAEVTCEIPKSPSPPPKPPLYSPPPPFLRSITPQIVSTTCHSALLAWTSPLPPDFVMEYLVSVPGFASAVDMTSETRFDMQGLQPGTRYEFQIASRISGDDDWSEQGTTVQGLTLSLDRDDESLEINVGRSGSCTSLQLALPNFGKCAPSEFLSVEWRTEHTADWQVVMDRVEVGDLPDNILSLDALDALSRYELRAKLHQDDGSVVEGPSTGGLLVDMHSGELRQAPQAKVLSSASVHIIVPPVSPCRKGLESRLLHTNQGQHEGWTPVPPHALSRVDGGLVIDPLRCPVGCQFKLRYPTIVGWNGESEATEVVETPRLPALVEGFQRLELKMTVAADAAAPPPAWGQGFAQAIAGLLSLDAAAVRHVETRGKGRSVTFDLKDSYDGTGDVPSGRLARLMLGSICRAGSNLAIGRPGRVSLSCPSENGTSPAVVNDGDLRQHDPFVWRACTQDSAAWWAVQMPEPVTDPLVHMLIGPCCAGRSNHEIAIHIGTKESKAKASPCAQLAKVEDLSSVVAVCKGVGTWLFISVRAADSTPAHGLSLAEVEVCNTHDATPAFQSPFLRRLDASSGLREMVEDGVLIQVAPELLPTSAGHDAALAKLVHSRVGKKTGSGLSLGLGAVVAVLGVVLLAWWKCTPLLRGCAPRGHTRIAADEKPNANPVDGDEEVPSDEEDEEDEEDGAEAGACAPGDGVPVTFETSDGTAIQWSVRIDGVQGMEQLFARFETAAAQAGFNPIGHLSVQYTDRTTGMVEQAWHDRILGEGTDVEVVKSATQLRVLLLGGAHLAAQRPAKELPKVALPQAAATKVAPPPAAVPVLRGPSPQAPLHVDKQDPGIDDPVNRI